MAEPSLLLGDYVSLVSGGSSGVRGIFVQALGEYADFACTVLRRAMAAVMTSAGPPPEGLVIGIVGAGSPVHSSGLAAATAATAAHDSPRGGGSRGRHRGRPGLRAHS